MWVGVWQRKGRQCIIGRKGTYKKVRRNNQLLMDESSGDEICAGDSWQIHCQWKLRDHSSPIKVTWDILRSGLKPEKMITYSSQLNLLAWGARGYIPEVWQAVKVCQSLLSTVQGTDICIEWTWVQPPLEREECSIVGQGDIFILCFPGKLLMPKGLHTGKRVSLMQTALSGPWKGMLALKRQWPWLYNQFLKKL